MATIDKNGKRAIIEKMRQILTDYENAVDNIGNECAFTDSIIFELPELAQELTKIL